MRRAAKPILEVEQASVDAAYALTDHTVGIDVLGIWHSRAVVELFDQVPAVPHIHCRCPAACQSKLASQTIVEIALNGGRSGFDFGEAVLRVILIGQAAVGGNVTLRVIS